MGTSVCLNCILASLDRQSAIMGADASKGPVFMRRNIRTATSLPLLASLVLLVNPSGNAIAEDLLGLYVGAAIGQSRLQAKDTVCLCEFQESVTETFDKKNLAFQAMLGVRPISWVGAEVDYLDFGKPRGDVFGFPASASVKGVAAFGVLYLPIPIVSAYVKAGAARLESAVNYSYYTPSACTVCLIPVSLNHTNTNAAGGVGAQYKFGSWTVRTEYQRFDAAGETPKLVSAGFTWSFP
jgi:opacity protein-like surface antigen